MKEREQRRKWPNVLLLGLTCAALIYSLVSYYRGARALHRVLSH